MQAFVVKVKYITNYQHPKKPAVMLKISKNLLSNTADEGNESQQGTHINQLPTRVVPETLYMSGERLDERLESSHSESPLAFHCSANAQMAPRSYVSYRRTGPFSAQPFQQTRGLSPTSQLFPSGGGRNALTPGGKMPTRS
jgi:hypothetical protein